MKRKKNPNRLKISDVAIAAGVSKQTVEYYVLIGLVRPLRIKGRRYFNADLIRRIRLVHRLNQSGYTLRAIRETYLSREN